MAEANSVKQDYAEIVSADYPELKTLDSLCQLSADRLEEHNKAIQTFQNRWALLRKEFAAPTGAGCRRRSGRAGLVGARVAQGPYTLLAERHARHLG